MEEFKTRDEQRRYKCLKKQIYTYGNYELQPIRDSDKEDIRKWRNSQIDILRQKSILTKEMQKLYFKEEVTGLFEIDFPDQLLWSVLYLGSLIGYGGLVHIDWEGAQAEISFLTSKERAENPELFKQDWLSYLTMLEQVAFQELKLKKIFTYAYAVRLNLFPILEESGFKKEQEFTLSEGETDSKSRVLIHAKFADLIRTGHVF